MPKYYKYSVCGYYLYFTAECVVECMHVHASDKHVRKQGSAKFFVRENGDTFVQKQGILNNREIRKIQAFIKEHYKEMYEMWKQWSDNGYYHGNSTETSDISKLNVF